MKKIYKLLPVMLFTLMIGFAITSCSDDDDDSIIGRWESTDHIITSGNVPWTINMALTFKSDKTGSIEEYWMTQTRASTTANYSMKFSWNTRTDFNGKTYIVISYASGDKNTVLFPGEDIVVWDRQYTFTGKILSVQKSNNIVLVFQKK